MVVVVDKFQYNPVVIVVYLLIEKHIKKRQMQRKNFLIIIKYLLFKEIAIIANKLQVVVSKNKTICFTFVNNYC